MLATLYQNQTQDRERLLDLCFNDLNQKTISLVTEYNFNSFLPLGATAESEL
jgi:hypothetical protein